MFCSVLQNTQNTFSAQFAAQRSRYPYATSSSCRLLRRMRLKHRRLSSSVVVAAAAAERRPRRTDSLPPPPPRARDPNNDAVVVRALGGAKLRCREVGNGRLSVLLGLLSAAAAATTTDDDDLRCSRRIRRRRRQLDDVAQSVLLCNTLKCFHLLGLFIRIG